MLTQWCNESSGAARKAHTWCSRPQNACNSTWVSACGAEGTAAQTLRGRHGRSFTLKTALQREMGSIATPSHCMHLAPPLHVLVHFIRTHLVKVWSLTAILFFLPVTLRVVRFSLPARARTHVVFRAAAAARIPLALLRLSSTSARLITPHSPWRCPAEVISQRLAWWRRHRWRACARWSW